MEAAIRSRTAAVVHDLDRALAMLDPRPSESNGRRLFAAYLSIESARELLCDAREHRAVLLLQHARKVLGAVSDRAVAGAGVEDQKGVVVTRYLDNALGSLGMTAN